MTWESLGGRVDKLYRKRKEMPKAHQNLTQLSYAELHELLEKSSILEGYQAEVFAQALREIPLYQNEARLQLAHSKAVLKRMNSSPSFDECLVLSYVQESVPSFYLSLTLRQVFAQGLVCTATKNPTPHVLRRAVARVYELPSFRSCPTLQRCAAELLLEGVASADDSETAHEFLTQFGSLPGTQYSKELRDIEACAVRQAKRVGRDPIVKIDLNQKLAAPVKAMGKLFGMGDFRMRVELRGLEYYDQAVVRVPAFNEKSARRVASKFISSFLNSQAGDDEKSAKIVDIFPPGSAWNSGCHPVLKLK
jgi:hypothetical protein